MKKHSRSSIPTKRLMLVILAVLAWATGTHAQKFSEWSTPVNLGPVINSPYDDNHPALSPNGLSLYFASTRPGGYGDFDIYFSQRPGPNDPWGPPQNLGPIINTSSIDYAPAFTSDGHWLYFGSGRPDPGRCGGTDLYRSYRRDPDDDFGWQDPENLGCLVNTDADENGPTIFEDEDTGLTILYFTSFKRPGGLGDFDIYASIMDRDGRFRRAALVAELSSPFRDTRSALRSDGLEIIFTSNRPGGVGGFDNWVSSRETTRDAWGPPENLGPILNSTYNDGAPALSRDGTTLIFYSNRPGGFGANDLYMSTRQKQSEEKTGDEDEGRRRPKPVTQR